MVTPAVSWSFVGPDIGVMDHVFVGRTRERRLLDGLVASVEGGGSAGVIIGEPGIGKTALLAQVARTSRARVLRVRGSQGEDVLPFAVAADLLRPLARHFADLPPTQAQALEVALALSDGPAPNPLAACAGALGVLAAAGDEEPLVILVDDAHWVDVESARLLAFVARRLSTEHVVMLFAIREQTAGAALPAWDLPTLRLTGLSPADCLELGRRLGLAVPEHLLTAVAIATGGNPLALLETLTCEDDEHRHAPGEPDVAVGRSAEAAWRELLGRLPDATRRALFVVAADHSAGLGTLPAVLAELGLELADLEPAERRHLVRVDADTVELRHPLLRRVILDDAALALRVTTYRALAAVAAPELRPWYLSLITTGPDEEVAGRLSAAAAEARGRGGYPAASRLAHRAAASSPS